MISAPLCAGSIVCLLALTGCKKQEASSAETGTSPTINMSPDVANMSGMDMLAMTIGNTADPTNSMDHAHIPVEVPPGVAVPRLSLNISRDWMTGLNLEIVTENYHFIPPVTGQNIDQLMSASIDGESECAEGHAHLYVNGEKIQRIYGAALHLPEALFKPGLNQVTVSINNHGHMYWTSNNRQILATLFLNLEAEDLVTHRFESFPATTKTVALGCDPNE
ncbi:MAG: hypothetical protein ABJH52_10770 [Henriciella sp.]